MQESGKHHHEISGRNLGIAIILNSVITIVEAAGGIIAGSIALVSDAAHNFSDVISMIISWFANRLSKRTATEKETFGYRRSEILAAFINSSTLITISVIIIIEAIQRFLNPVPTSAGLMISLAFVSIIVNGFSALLIRKDSHKSLNMRSAFLHLFGDMLTSFAVLAGGFAIKYLHWNWTDPVFSIIIAIYLLCLSWGVVRTSLRIIMQFTPDNIDIKEIASAIEKLKGVKNIHHVHVWQINEQDLMFEAHVDISEDINISGFENILNEIRIILKGYKIMHSTIQPEFSVDDRKQMIY
jgi:cobalt-zinc-cadmium efflux system protein